MLKLLSTFTKKVKAQKANLIVVVTMHFGVGQFSDTLIRVSLLMQKVNKTARVGANCFAGLHGYDVNGKNKRVVYNKLGLFKVPANVQM